MIQHPASDDCFGGFLDPLIDQRGDLLPQICSVVEPCEFKTLQGGARRGLEIVEGWSESRDGHGQSSNLKAGPKGPATEMISALY